MPFPPLPPSPPPPSPLPSPPSPLPLPFPSPPSPPLPLPSLSRLRPQNPSIQFPEKKGGRSYLITYLDPTYLPT